MHAANMAIRRWLHGMLPTNNYVYGRDVFDTNLQPLLWSVATTPLFGNEIHRISFDQKRLYFYFIHYILNNKVATDQVVYRFIEPFGAHFLCTPFELPVMGNLQYLSLKYSTMQLSCPVMLNFHFCLLLPHLFSHNEWSTFPHPWQEV